MNDVLQRIVFTGGPGSGKSTIIHELACMGYAVSRESGREIIRQQTAIEGDGVPWRNPQLYAELMLAQDMRSYQQQNEGGLLFYDRGIPDIIGYLKTIGEDVPEHFYRAAKLYRYHHKVFVFPPWPEIYAQDRERKQPFDEALRTYEAMVSVYCGEGYEVVTVPKAPVAQRGAFVLSSLTDASG